MTPRPPVWSGCSAQHPHLFLGISARGNLRRSADMGCRGAERDPQAETRGSVSLQLGSVADDVRLVHVGVLPLPPPCGLHSLVRRFCIYANDVGVPHVCARSDSHLFPSRGNSKEFKKIFIFASSNQFPVLF